MSFIQDLTPSAGHAVGASTVLVATGVFGTTISFATVGLLAAGAIIGTVVMLPMSFAGPALEVLLSENYPIINGFCQFALAAATFVLTMFIGLAILSAFVSLIANPFTLPMIVASSVSAAIILGFAGFVFSQIIKQHSLYERGCDEIKNKGSDSPNKRSQITIEEFTIKPMEP